MKHKIIILSTAVIAVTMATIGFGGVGMADETKTTPLNQKIQETPKVSMVIEDNNYIQSGRSVLGGPILSFGDGLDLEDDRGENSPFYTDIKDLFPGYDNIVIIDHIVENPDPIYVEPLTTYIFLTKEPFEYETRSEQFYYDMLGISIIINEKRGQEPFTRQSTKNTDDVYKEITKDGLLGIGRERFAGQGIDGTYFDLPTELTFIDNYHAVSIKGFLTLDQAGELAKAIRR